MARKKKYFDESRIIKMDASTKWLVSVLIRIYNVDSTCICVPVCSCPGLGHENLFQFRVVANKRFDYRIHENNKQV